MTLHQRPRISLAAVCVLSSAALLLGACSGDGQRPNPSPLGSPAASAQPTTLEPNSSEGGAAVSSPAPSEPSTTLEPVDPLSITPNVERIVAEGLDVPWGVAFLPDGTALVSERESAQIIAITSGARRVVATLDEVAPVGEGGLLGIAVSPTFRDDKLVYAYLSSPADNRVVTMTYSNGALSQPSPILTGIPNGRIHDGGRLLFADDDTLFVSTGETGEPDLAQDAASLAGKVLRITTDGQPAPGNPLDDSPVWTLGHRNIQGLAFDDSGRLWASEFGQNTYDELNLIEPKRNYGWPLVEGRGDLAEYRNPFVQWPTADASPSGLAFAQGSLWMGALRGQRLWQIPVTDEGTGKPRAWFTGEFGRIRSVDVTPEGNLWLTTSNRDGRGEPVGTDDRIIEVSLNQN